MTQYSSGLLPICMPGSSNRAGFTLQSNLKKKSTYDNIHHIFLFCLSPVPVVLVRFHMHKILSVYVILLVVPYRKYIVVVCPHHKRFVCQSCRSYSEACSVWHYTWLSNPQFVVSCFKVWSHLYVKTYLCTYFIILQSLFLMYNYSSLCQPLLLIVFDILISIFYFFSKH